VKKKFNRGGNHTTKKYLLYLLRWQFSTPILAVVLILLSQLPTLLATVIANLIGGLIFFWVDKKIFGHKKPEEIKEGDMDINPAMDAGAAGE
jgi:putative flippase GtrA